MFDSNALAGKPIRVILKTGHTLTGTIQSANSRVVSFLTTENGMRLKTRLGIPTEKMFAEVKLDEIQEFLELIPVESIDTYEFVEIEVREILLSTLNGKKVTLPGFQMKLTNTGMPGVVKIELSVPESSRMIAIPHLPIKDGTVEVPISLAFISYAREDEEFVTTTSQRLKETGIATWFDKRDLNPGDDWELQIEQGIENSDFCLMFISSTTVNKIGFKNREQRLALKQQSYRPRGTIFIIPILIDECIVPHDLKDLHWLRVSDPDWFDRLVQTVAPWYIKFAPKE